MKLQIKNIGTINASMETMDNLMVALMESKDFMDVMRVDCISKGDRIGAKAFTHRMEQYSVAINQIYNALVDKDYYKKINRGV